MMLGDDDGGEELHLSIPRGGPIYVPNMVSPLTRVPDFETSVCNELRSLESELASDTLEGCEEIIVKSFGTLCIKCVPVAAAVLVFSVPIELSSSFDRYITYHLGKFLSLTFVYIV